MVKISYSAVHIYLICCVVLRIIAINLAPLIQGVFLKHNLGDDEFVSKLLDRRWALSSPDTKINQIMTLYGKEGGLCGNDTFRNINNPCLGEGMMQKNHPFPSFYLVRDDLLHPLVNGNKARKLDAILPVLEDNAATDVVRSCSFVINLGNMAYVSVNFNVWIILNGNESNVALLGTHIDLMTVFAFHLFLCFAADIYEIIIW